MFPPQPPVEKDGYAFGWIESGIDNNPEPTIPKFGNLCNQMLGSVTRLLHGVGCINATVYPIQFNSTLLKHLKEMPAEVYFHKKKILKFRLPNSGYCILLRITRIQP